MKQLLVLLFGLLAVNSVMAAEPKTTGKVYLYQPEAELKKRWPCTEQAAHYIADVVKLFEFVVSHGNQKVPASGAMVIAIAPGQQLKVWAVNYQGEIDPMISGAFEELLNDGEKPSVVGGPVVFGYLFSLAGAPFVDKGLPFPNEWREMLVKKGSQPMETGALVSLFFPQIFTSAPVSPCQSLQ